MTFESSALAVRAATQALAAGELIVVLDSADRENEADLVGAAEAVDAGRMAFIIAQTSGIVCAPLDSDRCRALSLAPMVADNTDPHGTAFTVSVDHIDTGTGVSAADRSRTAHALAQRGTLPADLRRPGHIFPLLAKTGGVLARRGHTEAAVDLLTLARLAPVGVISELMQPDGTMRSGTHALRFAQRYGLKSLHIDQLVEYRARTEPLVSNIATSALPTKYGLFQAIAYQNMWDGTEHLALTMGNVTDVSSNTEGLLVRVHSECLTGDILGSTRCDCGMQLQRSARMIADEGSGIIIYLRGHEGRGIGLAPKIGAYYLQDSGLDTVDANLALGMPIDNRDYLVGAQILTDLGINTIRLITNNPAKVSALQNYGIDVARRVDLPAAVTDANLSYLRAKRDRMGHHITLGGDRACSP